MSESSTITQFDEAASEAIAALKGLLTNANVAHRIEAAKAILDRGLYATGVLAEPIGCTCSLEICQTCGKPVHLSRWDPQ